MHVDIPYSTEAPNRIFEVSINLWPWAWNWGGDVSLGMVFGVTLPLLWGVVVAVETWLQWGRGTRCRGAASAAFGAVGAAVALAAVGVVGVNMGAPGQLRAAGRGYVADGSYAGVGQAVRPVDRVERSGVFMTGAGWGKSPVDDVTESAWDRVLRQKLEATYGVVVVSPQSVTPGSDVVVRWDGKVRSCRVRESGTSGRDRLGRPVSARLVLTCDGVPFSRLPGSIA